MRAAIATPPSIRARLTRLLVAVALLWGVGVSVAVWAALQHEVDELLDETLQASAEVLAELLDAAESAPLPVQRAAAVFKGGDEHFAWQIVGARRVLMRSTRAPEQPLLPLALPGFADAAGGWRVYVQPLRGATSMLLVAQTRQERREAATELAAVTIGTAVTIALFSAWWLRRRVRRELHPLQVLSDALARYEPLPPVMPLAAATRRELQPVHAAIEALGERLARRVANERAFSAHAAHALRTPLAGIEMQLAVAEREAPPALAPRLARARQANARLTRVVTALLALFRSGAEPQLQPMALATWLPQLPHEPLVLQIEAAQPLVADADLLAAALINLLDNALRHGATSLRIRLDRVDGWQRLLLHDDGAGVPPARCATLARALAEQAYEGHMGLGLMLADLVARAHGGRLSLPEVEQGFAVELRLPQPAAERAPPGPA